ncbi:hypothetical protein F950_02526 [Acinetobacter soli NIPH 2899]|nr:hypothetical protein F950_02526 [Acinetobacter soli NIPH 2899]
MKKLQHLFKHAALLGVCISVAACNDNNDHDTAQSSQSIPQLSPAVGAQLKGSCTDLSGFKFDTTVVESATL